jgi:hypothetical protein
VTVPRIVDVPVWLQERETAKINVINATARRLRIELLGQLDIFRFGLDVSLGQMSLLGRHSAPAKQRFSSQISAMKPHPKGQASKNDLPAMSVYSGRVCAKLAWITDYNSRVNFP